MFLYFLHHLNRVKIATTEAEKEAIYRLRYQSFIIEMNKNNIENVDHERKMIKDVDDDKPGNILIYIGPFDAPKATARLTIYQPNKVPKEISKRYTLDEYPEFKDKKLAEVSRLTICAQHRKGTMLLSLVNTLYKISAKENVDIALLYTTPGLCKFYCKFGYRHYQSHTIRTSDGIRIAMINILSDINFYTKVNSPLKKLVKKYYGRGKNRVLNLETLSSRIQDSNCTPKNQTEYIYNKLMNQTENSKSKLSEFMKNLTRSDLDHIVKHSIIMNAKEGDIIYTEGLIEKEVYIVLSGSLTIQSQQNSILNKIETGDIFGEISFFTNSGERTGTVTANNNCELLMLSRKFVHKIAIDNPTLAMKLLFNMANVLATEFCSNQYQYKKLQVI